MVDYSNRTGIDKVVDMEKPCDIFGVRSVFRGICDGLVKRAVDSDNWFTFTKGIDENQVDIMRTKSTDGSTTVGNLVHESAYQSSSWRIAIYKYLMRDFLCYYESPKVIKYSKDAENIGKRTYDKFLVTSNVGVIAEWLGVPYEEAHRLYGSRVDGASLDLMDTLMPYVKLYTSKTGERKITKPRADIDLNVPGTRVMPLFALNRGLYCLFENASKNHYKVRFLKDGGEYRDMSICFNFGMLRDIYGDGEKLRDLYQAQYDGDFFGLKSLDRGYIRVIEVGMNIDSNPLRSINYARIVSIRKEEPDLSLLNVNMEEVVPTFMLYAGKINTQKLVSKLEEFKVGSSRSIAGGPLKNSIDVENWVTSQVVSLSTTFVKQLALFMLANAEMFGWYDGGSKKEVVKASSIGDFEAFNSGMGAEEFGNDEVPLDF